MKTIFNVINGYVNLNPIDIYTFYRYEYTKINFVTCGLSVRKNTTSKLFEITN